MWWMTGVFLLSSLGDPNWDLLIFTQHWPPTACAQYKEEGASRTCLRPKIADSWMIHGVWPTKLGTLGPAFCKPIPFNEDDVEDIAPELMTYWPNLEGGKSTASLWEHEWLKHGTCATSLSTISNENEYFKQGLDWFSKYNMTNILRKDGIVPSQTNMYKLEDFHNSVKSAIGKNPSIRCIIEKHTKKAWLFELRICFDQYLELADCDGTMDDSSPYITNCPLHEPILYPIHAIDSPKEPFTPLRRRRSVVRELSNMINYVMFLDWFFS